MSTLRVLLYFGLSALFAGSVLANSHSDVVTSGSIEIAHAWSRTVPVAGMNAAGYMELKNAGDKPITLVSFTSDSAKKTSLHESVKEGDMVSMQALPDGITIPANNSVTLQPGGLHLMFLDINEPFVEGEKIPVKLIFDSGEEISASLMVKGLDDTSHEGKMHH